jgi:hypothetical protein
MLLHLLERNEVLMRSSFHFFFLSKLNVQPNVIEIGDVLWFWNANDRSLASRGAAMGVLIAFFYSHNSWVSSIGNS